ncbi:MAG: CAP domain-containing protein [Polyangiales bacterium]
MSPVNDRARAMFCGAFAIAATACGPRRGVLTPPRSIEPTTTTTTTAATTTTRTTTPRTIATPTTIATATETGASGSPEEVCVADINAYRATLGLPALNRWFSAESCAGGEALSDSKSHEAHGAFGHCDEMAQNECPGWPGPPGTMIGDCLKMMWGEGPGGGHYENMISPRYTEVSCGFATLADGSVWSVQDFR